MYWIIIERPEEDHHKDGIRFKAFPCIDDDIQKTIKIVKDDNQKYWIVKEVDK